QNEATLLVRMGDGTVRFAGPEHVVFNGTARDDRVWSSEGDDTIRGNNGDDWINGGDGNDNHVGGLGDDILLDPNGDDTLKGGDGNDTLSSGQGFGGDLNQGGRGSDFIVGGNDFTETLAGPGNDFVFAGDDSDEVLGDDGDDWIDGGGGANAVMGDNGAPFNDDPNTPGNDVIDGDGMDQDMHAEGGDDIMLLGAGVQRSEGMAGFDWSIHKLDPLPANSDMNLVEPAVPALPVANRDRFRQIEGLSGWFRDDVLRGNDADAVVLAPADALTPAGVARIAGLQDVLGGATAFNAGNIILGGAGSDLLEGRGGDDILDGDRWLDAQVSVRDRLDPTIELRRVDSLSAIRADVIAGTINPGQLRIVRQIRTQAPGADIDTAVFSDVRANYLLVTNADGSRTVAQIAARAGRPTVDGVDTLRNIERLQFADVTIDLATGAAVGPAVTLSAASATFADRAVGTVSAFQAVTLTNTGTAPLNITGLALAGANPGDFNRGGTCSTSTPIAAGASCTIEVNFAPTATGPRSASVDITSNAAGSPHSIALSGTGVAAAAPAASLGPTSATFADQTVGIASATQTVTLTNTGTAPL
ncbi:MAG TPA: choice-of-anchor D domain-containing protein, partial [Candidatus Limnocylindrales bacterium]